ncbi:MAG: hypothetical protein KGJ56_09235 [Gammaproteobacteria bacterium]|nr:hypothetical protein [Gammaproteobacteria bacterium]
MKYTLSAMLTGAALVLILVAAFVAYLPGLDGAFLFDDYSSIVNNTHLVMPSLALPNLLEAAFSAPSGPLFRPISVLSFALDRYFFGAGAFSFKLTNLLIHLAVGVVLFLLTARLLRHYRRQYQPTLQEADVRFASLAVTAAWLLHPINLTAVLYVVQRETSLAALFTALGVLFYVLGRERQLHGQPGWPFIWIAAPLAGVVGMFCKESAALLPLFMLAVEAPLFRFRNARARTDRGLVIYYMLAAGLPAVVTAWILVFHPLTLLGAYAGRDFTPVERLLSEARVVTLYLKDIVYPQLHALSLYHDDLAVSTGLFSPASTVLAVVFLVALLSAALAIRKRQPLITAGVLWYFCGQLLESTIFPLDLMYEHRNYLPDYGVLLAMAAGFLFIRPAAWRFSRRTLVIAAIVTLGGLTWVRSTQWSNNIAQAFFEVKYHPDSPRATFALAFEYVLAAERGDKQAYRLAKTNFERTAALDKTALAPYIALIELNSELGMPVDQDWYQQLTVRAGEGPIRPLDLVYLEYLVQCAGSTCKPPPGTLLRILTSALNNPLVQPSGCVRGNLLNMYAQVLGDERSIKAAFQAMTASVRACPGEPQLRINLITSYINFRAFAAAREQLDLLRRRNHFGQLDNRINELEGRLQAAERAVPQSGTAGSPVN